MAQNWINLFCSRSFLRSTSHRSARQVQHWKMKRTTRRRKMQLPTMILALAPLRKHIACGHKSTVYAPSNCTMHAKGWAKAGTVGNYLPTKAKWECIDENKKSTEWSWIHWRPVTWSKGWRHAKCVTTFSCLNIATTGKVSWIEIMETSIIDSPHHPNDKNKNKSFCSLVAATLENMTILEQISSDTIVFLQTHKRIWPASQRDALFWSHMKNIKEKGDPNAYDEWLVCNHSIELDAYPANVGKCVRIFLTVIMYCQTYVNPSVVAAKGANISRDDLTCKITYCSTGMSALCVCSPGMNRRKKLMIPFRLFYFQ